MQRILTFPWFYLHKKVTIYQWKSDILVPKKQIRLFCFIDIDSQLHPSELNAAQYPWPEQTVNNLARPNPRRWSQLQSPNALRRLTFPESGTTAHFGPSTVIPQRAKKISSIFSARFRPEQTHPTSQHHDPSSRRKLEPTFELWLEKIIIAD